MKKFVIERDLPGAGKLTAEELEGISRKSCDVLLRMGPSIQWLESYVTDDKIYCVYAAVDASLLREHGRLGEFPVTHVAEVARMIGPETTGPDYAPGVPSS